MNFFQALNKLLTKFIQTSYMFLTNVPKTFYKLIVNFWQISYKLFTNFLRSYYKHSYDFVVCCLMTKVSMIQVIHFLLQHNCLNYDCKMIVRSFVNTHPDVYLNSHYGDMFSWLKTTRLQISYMLTLASCTGVWPALFISWEWLYGDNSTKPFLRD